MSVVFKDNLGWQMCKIALLQLLFKKGDLNMSSVNLNTGITC